MHTKIKEAIRDNNHRKLLKYIGMGGDVNSVDQNGNTPLMWAVYRGYEDMVSSLLNYGANPNQKCAHGLTPKDEAVLRKRKNIINLLSISEVDYV